MTETNSTPATQANPRRRTRLLAGGAGLALLAIGAISGAGVYAAIRPEPRMAFDPAMATTEIRALDDDSLTKIEGRVTDIFGNKFVLEDATGRALVDTGRDGEDGTLVSTGETVKVQGRFDRKVLRASALQHADGRTDELRLGPPLPHGPDDRGPGGSGPHRHSPVAPPPPPGGPQPPPNGNPGAPPAAP